MHSANVVCDCSYPQIPLFWIVDLVGHLFNNLLMHVCETFDELPIGTQENILTLCIVRIGCHVGALHVQWKGEGKKNGIILILLLIFIFSLIVDLVILKQFWQAYRRMKSFIVHLDTFSVFFFFFFKNTEYIRTYI